MVLTKQCRGHGEQTSGVRGVEWRANGFLFKEVPPQSSGLRRLVKYSYIEKPYIISGGDGDAVCCIQKVQ